MKNVKKALLLFLCVAAIVGVTVMGTLAWLTDQSTVKNTMTVGKVDITVDETKVNPDGTEVPDADRVTENTYHLIPGKEYIKDPTMTVNKDSEESYVRMLLTLNYKTELDEIFAPGVDLQTIFVGYDATAWIYEGETTDALANTVTYEFRYKETVKPNGEDVVLEPLFEMITIPGTVTGEQLEMIQDLEITVIGHAIQTYGFADEDAAWAAFAEQTAP